LDFSFKKNTSYEKLGIFESLKGFWTKKYATESASGAGGISSVFLIFLPLQ